MQLGIWGVSFGGGVVISSHLTLSIVYFHCSRTSIDVCVILCFSVLGYIVRLLYLIWNCFYVCMYVCKLLLTYILTYLNPRCSPLTWINWSCFCMFIVCGWLVCSNVQDDARQRRWCSWSSLWLWSYRRFRHRTVLWSIPSGHFPN